MNKNFISIKSEQEVKDLISSNENVIVDFYADWCRPCMVMINLIKELESEGALGNIIIASVNVEENSDYAVSNSVRSIPNFQYFKNGEKVGSKVGAMTKADFIDSFSVFNQRA